MSQSQKKISINIETTITIDDAGEPQAVTVEGFGNMTPSALRVFADEALDRHFGTHQHPFLSDVYGDRIGPDAMVFEIRKSKFGA